MPPKFPTPRGSFQSVTSLERERERMERERERRASRNDDDEETPPGARGLDGGTVIERLEEVERKERGRDRESGVLASVDGAVTTLTNGHDEHRKEFRAFATETRKALKSLRSESERAQAAPLALVAYFILNQAGAGTTPTLGVTVGIVLLAVFRPELAAKFVRRAQGIDSQPATTSERPPAGENTRATRKDHRE